MNISQAMIGACSAAGPWLRAAGRLAGVIGLSAVLLGMLTACGVRNSPHPSGAERGNTLFTAFTGNSPKTLDPTSSYSTDETPYTYQIYEPPYRYHYLKRPYTLEPRVAAAVVAPTYLDKQGRPLPAHASGAAVAESVYDIPLRQGVLFAPHPAFARDAQGQPLYHALRAADVADKRSPLDFAASGTRELTADDLVYAIRRLASPRVTSPIFSTMADYIVGLKEYGQALAAADKRLRANLAPGTRDLPFLDLRALPFEGAVALDRYTVRIRIKGVYPQFKYWLAMTFFAPIPWEAEKFYSQPGMAANNLSLNVWAVGTGPYMLQTWVANRRHVLVRNPNFRGEPYPCDGEAGDQAAGLLADCGKTMPFIDRIVFDVEKEAPPHDAKFVQGFYDIPEAQRGEYGVQYSTEILDSKDRAEEFRVKQIRTPLNIETGQWYLGFNWLDPVVGKGATAAQSERNRKLRQALSIAIDWEEYVRIFERKGGMPAHGVVPPGIFGQRDGPAGFNRTVYDEVDGKPRRKPLAAARRLLAEAGYPDGREAASGRPLVLNYDYQRALTPAAKSEIDWLSKQFGKLGIQLEVRATDYNRFQDKMKRGVAQIFFWGWNADYPDAENFLFLLYGPNSKAATNGNGENASNYQNDEYDRLFEQMRFLDDGPQKQQIIDRMLAILRDDAPWSFGFNPWSGGAYHQWVHNAKPTQMVRDLLQYMRLDSVVRSTRQAEWNRPLAWPLGLLFVLLIAVVLPAVAAWRRKQRATALAAPERVS